MLPPLEQDINNIIDNTVETPAMALPEAIPHSSAGLPPPPPPEVDPPSTLFQSPARSVDHPDGSVPSVVVLREDNVGTLPPFPSTTSAGEQTSILGLTAQPISESLLGPQPSLLDPIQPTQVGLIVYPPANGSQQISNPGGRQTPH